MKSFICLILIGFVKSIVADSSCADWLPYKDEKCYKIVDDTLRTFSDAEKICESLEGSPTLPIIRTSEEQNFLSTYLFKTQKKADNFWIGAKFLNNSFKWIDNSDLIYTNWDPNGTKNKTDYCVQIQADDLLIGKWNDEQCVKKNAVVCEKMQPWPLSRLQKEFLNERKQHRNLEDKFEEAKKEIKWLQQNPVPINFVYVQLSSQPDPKTLWPTLQWQDVTSEYAGLFFRAEGMGSLNFGAVQAENSPRLTEVRLEQHPATMDNGRMWGNTNLQIGNMSSGIGVYSGSDSNLPTYTHRFYQSGGEIRPRNMAMRIWKRTN